MKPFDPGVTEELDGEIQADSERKLIQKEAERQTEADDGGVLKQKRRAYWKEEGWVLRKDSLSSEAGIGVFGGVVAQEKVGSPVYVCVGP